MKKVPDPVGVYVFVADTSPEEKLAIQIEKQYI